MPRTGDGLGPRASRGGRGEAPRRRRSALGSKRVVGTDADGRDVWEVAVSSGYRADGRQRRVTSFSIKDAMVRSSCIVSFFSFNMA